LVQITPLSVDNRCLPGAEFHFTLPVAVPAYWRSGADHLVVSRQSMFAWVKIPFHDTDDVCPCDHRGTDLPVVRR
ncbi:hypothetical protein, partial [Aeromonas caviae]|uniref:hypothetical protein n=1 Tax=Aeromonas caviae TaxID=648 RepID=UPI0030148A45